MKNDQFRSKLPSWKKSALFFGAVGIATAALAASSTSDTRGGSISSGTHKVEDNAASTDSNDPRAETYFNDRLDTNSARNNGVYTASYDVVSAYRTTIGQVLHCNDDLDDKCKPVVFLTAYKDSKGKVKLCTNDCRPSDAGNFTTTPDSTFKVKIEASTSSAKVTVSDGTYSQNKTINYPSDRANNGNYTMRFGVYHHHTGRYDYSNDGAVRPRSEWPKNPKAFSKAEVKVTSTDWVRS
jgi:hypothetical protein